MHSRRKKRHNNLDIGLAPFIDVVFLLLCFFVVTTSFESFQQLTIELPETVSHSQQENQQFTELAIDKAGTIFIGDMELKNASKEEVFAALYDLPTTKPLLIKADAQTSHGDVVRVMDIATGIGFSAINVASIEQK